VIKVIKILTFLSFFILVFEISAKEKKKIEYSADRTQMDKNIAPDAKRLIGNVVFKHEGTIMYCDSAYFYSERNSLDAFDNVHIKRGDSIQLFSQTLKYDGNIRYMRAKDSVLLIDDTTFLYTDIIDYDIENDLAFYKTGGVIISGNDTLESIKGYYYSENEIFHFKDSVVLKSEAYRVYSDTLLYETKTDLAIFLGPTEMFGDSSYMYCERGWYDSKNDIANIVQNAYLQEKELVMLADSIYYSKPDSLAQAFGNIEIQDTINDYSITGKYGIHHTDTESNFITDSACFVQYSSDDTLYIHGDTLGSFLDSLKLNRFINAHYKVKIFSREIQGKCDSLVYFQGDSIINFFYNPVIWSDENQLTGDFIQMYTSNNRADSLKLHGNGFIISQEDSVKYNQIKGKLITGYMKDNKLRDVLVNGNAQTLYYIKENEDDEVTGVNKAEATDLRIKLKDKSVETIKFDNHPQGIMYPPKDLPLQDYYLKGFEWRQKERPLTLEDIFIWEKEKLPKQEPEKDSNP
jgi:lipopolysaccharide export system protein LptA